MQPSPLSALLELTEAIGSAATLEATYEAALDGLERGFDVSRASILLFDPDGVMRFKAWRGLSDEYRAAVEGHTPWAPGQPAPAPIVVADLAADPDLEPYRDLFAREGISGLAFVPLVAEGGVIGKFMIYGDVVRRLSPDHLAAARGMGFLIGFAVERTKRTMEADRERQHLLFALNAASMGTWEWNVADASVRWSDNLEQIHGLPPGTFDGAFSSYEKEIHPDDRPRVMASIQRALSEGAPHDVDYRIVAPDGTVRWVMGAGRLERDGQGRPLRMTGVCMDISPRKRIEEENARLLAQETELRNRLTQLTDGSRRLLTTLDPQAVVDEVIALASRVVAADAYAVWRRQADGWRVLGARGLSRAFSDTVLTDKEKYPFDAPIVAADVTSIPVLNDRRAAYDAEGIASLVSVPLSVSGGSDASLVFYYRAPHTPTEAELRVGVALGYTAGAAIGNAELYAEQQRLRAAAEESESRMSFLAEASRKLSSLDYEKNLSGLAQLAVPALADWCAVDLLAADNSLHRLAFAHVDSDRAGIAEELRQRYPIDLSTPRGVGNVLRTGQPELYESVSDEMLAANARDAEHLQMLQALGIRSVMLIPLQAPSGTLGVLSFVRISDTRPFSQADVSFASELGRRAGLAVENARLFTEARVANRLKDEFVATLSHELRTPLNVIVGRARMLTTTDPSPAVRQHIDAIERNSVTLSRLVEDLLDISRMAVGQIRLERQSIAVPAVVEAAVQTVRAQLETKGLVLTVDVSDDLPAILADQTRVQQILWNLLTNAIKFTPSGGSVRVGAAVEGSRVRLDVSDSGEGLRREFLPHVFDMFWQASTPGNRKQAGLGLGLSIVKRLAELHGGEAACQSAGPGLGATFTVWLPAAGQAAEVSAG